MPGSGLIVSPSAVKAYGQAVGLQAGTLQRISSVLTETHLSADAFGKLPEAGDLHQAYTQHATEVQDITAKLPDQIQHVAEGLYSTAKSYSDLEQGMTEGITSAFSPVSFGGGGKGGNEGGGNAVGYGAHMFGTLVSYSKKGYDWVNEPESAIPAYAVGSIIGASSGLEGMLDAAISWVLNHVPELPNLLDKVTGDTEALKSAARTWHDMGERLNDVIRELKGAAASLPEAWAGDASMSFGTFMGDVVRALSIIAGQMGETQQILEQAASEAEFAHETIVMIIREVVEWVAANLLVDAATLGLATGVEALGTAAFLSDKVLEAEQAASKLADVYRALLTIVKELQNLKGAYEKAKGLDRLKKFYTMAKDFDDKALDVGKLKNMRAFGNDGKLTRLANKMWDSGKHGKNADALEKVAHMTKTEFFTTAAVKGGKAGAIAMTGLSADPGRVGLAKDYLEGGASDLTKTGQGAADAVGLGPSVPQAPPTSRIDAIINPPTPPKEP